VELTLLAILLAALLVLSALADFVPRAGVAPGVAAVASLGFLLAVAALARSGTIVLPLGPAGGASLVLDPMAAGFVLLLCATMPCTGSAPLRLAAALLCVLAGDGLLLAAGLLLLGGRSDLRMAATASACLIAAFALCGTADDFADLRAVPPEGWRADTVFVLVLAGAGAFSRISLPVAGYVALRVLVDLCGAGQPPWWGAVLLLAGGGVALLGSLRAALAGTLHAFATCAPLQPFGMAASALGAALLVRAADLPAAVSLALSATWLALVSCVLCRVLLLLIAEGVEAGAGTRRLDRLGGLIRGMPVTAAACGAALLAAAALPPGLGFAAFWLALQSLLAAARIGGRLAPAAALVAATATALSIGLMVAAAARLFGAAFLGRPRTPRTAAAEEATRPRRLVLGGLAAATALLGLFPALALLPATGWFGALDPIAALVLRPGAEAPGYGPIGTAVLLAIAGVAIVRLSRGAGERREPVWSGGFAAPPPWLPFGDPATQFGPASFSDPLASIVGLLPPAGPLWRHIGRWPAVLARFAAAVMAP
jgi:hypothetical protein